jgi:2-dehydropantoate 2-reductase
MKLAVLGPGGVGGLLAVALQRAGEDVTVIAREPTAETIAEHGVRVSSVTLGEFTEHPRAVARLQEPVDALIVATKAGGLQDAVQRVESDPPLVLPLLNGLDHVALLRGRFDPPTVVAGTIRVEADNPQPGVVVHTSRFLRVEMASRYEHAREGMLLLARLLADAGVQARGDWPISQGSEATVMWSKLVRLNALACVTSAHDELLGEIRSQPALRAELEGAIREASAVAQAEGAADVDAQTAIDELARAHDTLGSSMQRDIAAGREPELDAIPGSVLRAAARHGIECPTIERLVGLIAARAGVPVPVV